MPPVIYNFDIRTLYIMYLDLGNFLSSNFYVYITNGQHPWSAWSLTFVALFSVHENIWDSSHQILCLA